jgi:hydrogenase maturation protein HypF
MAGQRSGSSQGSASAIGSPVTFLTRSALEITGIVQGVGFRPFVYRIAIRFKLTGWVRNTPAGVTVQVQGESENMAAFLLAIVNDAPPLAVVGSIAETTLPPVETEADFVILPSGEGAATAEIPPDGDVCKDCLSELFDPSDRRYRYSFITCTNCGPRYSIITGIPYDRPLTTMAAFPLCDACRKEYENPLDRRFHAQPLACPECGPSLTLLHDSGNPAEGDPVEAAVALLKNGGIVAIKGVGGYHLAVDATSSDAVRKLRLRKRRVSKPFAIMVADIAEANKVACLEPLEERLLTGPERPIVLLKKRASTIATEVAPDSNYLGVMLPSTPLHHLLLRDFGRPLVMTSGNRSSEPIAYLDEDALNNLSGIADAFLIHDRPIHTGIDDSVIRVFRGNPLFLRRSRGYAPRAVHLNVDLPPLLAVGAELKGAFCLTRNSQAFMSQHIGDLQNVGTVQSLRTVTESMKRLLGIMPQLVAHDMHPDYLSTRYAVEQVDLPAIAVQHHHAHMASCMAENRLDGDVIGVVFDGTGHGDDGTVWGGEFLVGGYERFMRAGRFRPVPLPGGDAAVREPYRMALAYCHDAFGSEAFDLQLSGWSELSDTEKHLLRTVIEKRLNSPLTSSCGRLFDAVAALIGASGIISYEGQAAIELEAIAEGGDESIKYPYTITETDGMLEIDWRPLFAAIAGDLGSGVHQSEMARGFHSTLVNASLDTCRRIRSSTGLDRVVLSGGVFQNRLLTEELWGVLEKGGFQVFSHRLVPPNDGGIALGQAMIAGCNFKKRGL